MGCLVLRESLVIKGQLVDTVTMALKVAKVKRFRELEINARHKIVRFFSLVTIEHFFRF